MSRAANNADVLYCDLGSSFWGETPSEFTITWWSAGDSDYGSLQDMLSLGGGGAKNDNQSMTVEVRGGDFLYVDFNATLVGGSPQSTTFSTVNPATSINTSGGWNFFRAWGTLDSNVHGIAVNETDITNNTDTVGNFINNSETSIRYLSVGGNLIGTKCNRGLYSGIAIWKGLLSASDLIDIYTNKTHPEDVSSGTATLMAYFLDENTHVSGTEELTDTVGGTAELVVRDGGMAIMAYNASEPGISAKSGGGGLPAFRGMNRGLDRGLDRGIS